MKSILVFGSMALAIGQASAATRVFNITGATAFRSSSNTAIIAVLGGAGTTKYAYTGTSGAGGSNRAIYVGTMAAFPGDTIIVRASWSGSTTGIKNVEDNTAIEFLDDNVITGTITGDPATNGNPVTTGGYNLGGSGLEAPEYENAVAQWSFSDVDKLLSERPTASFGGGPVGVVPFMFVAGEDASVGTNNMTDKLHEYLWSVGQIPESFFNGNTADVTTVYATGRDAGSGTRAAILSETQYGAFTSVVQFGATFTGTRTDAYPTGRLVEGIEYGNSGGSSNSVVRDVLTRSAQDFGDVTFVSYLTISDALAAIGEGAKEMKYNGVPFSVEGVKKGAYTLWSYQQLYRDNDASAEEVTFDGAFRTALPATITEPNAIAITNMSVVRTGGDGGPITKGPLFPAPNP